MNIQLPFLRVAGILATLCATALVGSSAEAAQIFVPQDYPTIQDAINAAAPGDEVLVQPGTYNEYFLIDKQDIKVRSFLPGLAILDATGIFGALITVEVPPGGPLPEVSGFEICGAKNAPAILVIPHAGAPSLGLVLRDCYLHDNDHGAVVVHDSFLSAQSCVFELNWNFNGGVVDVNHSGVVLNECRFYGNVGTYGGAVDIQDSGFGIYSCEFETNTAPGVGGGGLYVQGCSPGSVCRVVNSLFFQNHTSEKGAGVMAGADADFDIINCTIADNGRYWEPVGSGLYVAPTATVHMTNSIVRENVNGEDIVADGTLNVEYSAVPSQFSGVGNTDQLPEFVNPWTKNYGLRVTSPCVDAGNNSGMPAGLFSDRSGNPRFVDDPEVPDSGTESATIDMGCQERTPFQYATRYVDIHAAPGGDGLSWATAFNNLQDALALAPSPDFADIWVTGGTYYPDSGSGDRTSSFTLHDGVHLYGGFAGDETSLDQRDWRRNETILSGNIGASTSHADNSYHVVEFDGNITEIVLDGCTVEDGRANGSVTQSQRGGGIYIHSSWAYHDWPIVRNCLIRDNESTLGGAGAFVDNNTTTFLNSVFTNNVSDAKGGAIRLGNTTGPQPTRMYLYGCQFNGNAAEEGGAVSVLKAQDFEVINCTFYKNTSTTGTGGGLWAKDITRPVVAGSIFWQNSGAQGTTSEQQVFMNVPYSLDRSCLEGWTGGGLGVHGDDPRFVDAAPSFLKPDLRLCADSPCINTGATSGVPVVLEKDLMGLDRVIDGDVDMGAFESTAAALSLTTPRDSLGAGSVLELNTCGGLPGGPLLFALTDVNGAPTFTVFLYGFFDQDGRHEFTALIDSGLSGLIATLNVYGYAAAGGIEESNELTITFE